MGAASQCRMLVPVAFAGCCSGVTDAAHAVPLIGNRTVDAKDVNRGDKAACNAERPLLYSERRKIYPALCE